MSTHGPGVYMLQCSCSVASCCGDIINYVVIAWYELLHFMNVQLSVLVIVNLQHFCLYWAAL